MRIAFVLNNWGAWGGSGTYHAILIRSLQKMGYDCQVCLPFVELEAWELPSDIPFHLGIKNTVKAIQGCSTWVSWAIGHKISISSLLSRKKTRPKIVSVNHGDFRNPWCLKVMRKESPFADKIVGVSESSLAAVPEEYRHKGRVIEGPIDRDRLVPFTSRTDMQKSLRLGDENKVLLYLGRLDPRKGYHQIIDLTRFLPSNWRTLIVGDGIESISPQLLYGNYNVMFCGPSPFPGDFIQLADCSISLSETEGFGLSVVETMISGVPTISPKVGILEELDIGYVVPLGLSSREYANIVVEADRNRGLAKNHKAILDPLFTTESFVQKWVSVLTC